MKIRSIAFLNLLIYCSFLNPFQLSADSGPAFPDATFGQVGTLNGICRTTEIQSDGKIVMGGLFTMYGTTPLGYIVRLNTDGTLDNSFNSGTGADNRIYCSKQQPDGKILIGGAFTSYNGTSINRIARLNVDGSLDNTFNPGSGLSDTLYSIFLQPDGKILIGGRFTSYNGTSINRIARLNSDGSLDNTFNSGTGANNSVWSIGLQADGKILIGGDFTNYNGLSKNRLARLNSDGTMDTGFSNGTSGSSSTIYSIIVQPDGFIMIAGSSGSYNGASIYGIARLNTSGFLNVANGFSAPNGVNGAIYSMVLQPDGKIIIGGTFWEYTLIERRGFARINTDGSLDMTFHVPQRSYPIVYSIALQTDSKIVVGGKIAFYDEAINNNFFRLNANGTLDNTFYSPQKGPNKEISDFVIQSDGKIIIGGYFTRYDGVSVNRIARLNTNGTLDNTFNVGTGLDETVNKILLQPDGKIILGGYFTTYNGISRNRIVRLNADGTLDNTFNPGTGLSTAGGEYIRTMALQGDGKILIGGEFISYNGTSIKRLARLNADGTLDNTISVGPATSIPTDLLVQPDGKILVGGITSYNGTTIKQIMRLNSNGSIDASFNPGAGPDITIWKLGLQPDGKIIIAGVFTKVNNITRNNIARLNSDGSLDITFNPGTSANNVIYALKLLPDGKILIGGMFSRFAGVTIGSLARISPDGSLDAGFVSSIVSGVRSLNVQSDGKVVAVGSFNTCSDLAYNYLVRLQGEKGYNTIKGKVFADNNDDCSYQASDKALPLIIVKATPGNYYGASDNSGNYTISVDSGTVAYSVSQQWNNFNSKFLYNTCTPVHTVNSYGQDNEFCCYDFADSVKPCFSLNISIQNTLMRRCFRGSTFANYCNYGGVAASNVEIKIEYPPHVIPISSSPMWSSKDGSVLTYTISTLPSGQCGTISIIDSVACGNQSITGLTQCIKATISPVSTCVTENPGWDKSSIKVTGSCVNDSARFVIVNKGQGNSSGNHNYRVFVNDTLVHIGTFSLQKGDGFIVNYPAGTDVIRLEADQHALHPGKSRPRAIVEGCGTTGSVLGLRGLVITSSPDDLDNESAITCNRIIASYDPNEKQVTPVGIGATHQIPPGEELEFIVHFQNTGTDTAFTVKIVDTLDINLDHGSLMKGSSSHPYQLEITGKGNPVLTYTFNNINLPDSTTNKVKSQGLVSYRIKVPDNISLGTVLHNKAYIFFDYNDPIITNKTMHTVGITVEQDIARGSELSVGNVIAKPILLTTPPSAVCAPQSIDLTMAAITAGSTSNITLDYYLNPIATSIISDPANVNTSGTYYIVGTNEIGSTDTSAVNVLINLKPSVVIVDPSLVTTPDNIDLTEIGITYGSTAGLNYSYFTDPQANNILLNPEAISQSGTYYIVGIDGNGCSDTASVTALINTVSSVYGSTGTSSVKLFPNPSSGTLNLQMDQQIVGNEMKIYSVVGNLYKRIELSTETTQQINLESLSAGTYVYEIWRKEGLLLRGIIQLK